VNGLLKRELGHGGEPPRGWRLAWYEPRRRVAVFYPAPIHFVARALREMRYRAELAWRAPSREQRDVFDLQRVHREREKLAAEYTRGYLRGWQDSFDQWVETIEQLTADDLKH
jgi:hypothetical protein